MLTIEEITNLYLYGSKSTPSDLAAESILRPPANQNNLVKTSVNINDYMTSGPGRFADPGGG